MPCDLSSLLPTTLAKPSAHTYVRAATPQMPPCCCKTCWQLLPVQAVRILGHKHPCAWKIGYHQRHIRKQGKHVKCCQCSWCIPTMYARPRWCIHICMDCCTHVFEPQACTLSVQPRSRVTLGFQVCTIVFYSYSRGHQPGQGYLLWLTKKDIYSQERGDV